MFQYYPIYSTCSIFENYIHKMTVAALRDRSIRPVYVDSRFLDKGRRDDKEDEHDKYDVEHRRQVDLTLFLVGMDIIQMFAHGRPL